MKDRKTYRIGERHQNNYNEWFTIINYNNSADITIKFDNGEIIKTTYYNISKKEIINDFTPRVRNVGYNGKGNFNRTECKNGRKRNTKCYDTWLGILQRCYSEEYHNLKPTYTDCKVCEEWKCYQTFAKWYYENYYEIEGEIMALDKDMLVHGNKIYSPNTCIFMPTKFNSILTSCKSVRGDLPIGITLKNNKYCVRVSDYITSNKRLELGYYDDINVAFQVYKKEKENVIKRVADLYKDKIPQKLYDAMYSYEVEITD